MKTFAHAIAAATLLAGLTTSAMAQDEAAPEATPAPAPAPAPFETIMPEDPEARAFLEQFGFSQAAIHGDTVYLSGVILGPPPEGLTREEAYTRSLEAIGETLKRAGSSWDDVVDITTYHVDIEQSLPALAAAKNRFVKAPFPAWTAIDIDRLFTPDGELEIKVTARVSGFVEAARAE
ncbi:Rid family hydrolase [Erythrobacter rubeus]|uniref:RidA family protein n=1 Tax=Erythrobacter rubeus TaxID=2760803 RepID=A0ABR8KS03_9SPHN|nr:Rid family hydrolase [Erythrobacter rubeus]MBD2840886.1 hypothetical protein [Erythrobacter rubeus]